MRGSSSSAFEDCKTIDKIFHQQASDVEQKVKELQVRVGDLKNATDGSLLTAMTSHPFPFFPRPLKVPTGSISLSPAELHANSLLTR